MNYLLLFLFGVLVGLIVGYYIGVSRYSKLASVWREAALTWRSNYYLSNKESTDDL